METTDIKPFIKLCYCTSLKQSSSSFAFRTMDSGNAFAIISSARRGMNNKQKDAEQANLAYEAKKVYQCFSTELRGGVVETDFMEKIDSRDELSVFIRGISLSNAIKLGIKNKQELILYCNGVDFLALIIISGRLGKIGDVFMEFEYRHSNNDFSVIQNAVKEYGQQLLVSASPVNYSVVKPQSSHFKLFEMYKRYEREGLDRWLVDGNKIM